jgi:hypothetical protein
MAEPLGAAPGIILGVGLGAAASTAIEPTVEGARQTNWSNNQLRVLSPELNAMLVAQGAIGLGAAAAQAEREGIDRGRFDELVYLAQRAPTYGEAQDLRRRDKISRAQLFHSFAKAQIEEQYWDALADLVDDRLSPPIVALAIVRGLMQNPGILPVGPPTSEGKIKAFPVSDIDPVAESAAGGFDKGRLAVLAGISGRPMGPESAAAAVFRDILEKVDYDRAISEGDVRNEWANAIFETARQIPSVANYVTAHLKAWINEDEMNTGVARHGMSKEDAHLLYLAAGRPAAPGQMATAAARGIDGPDGRPMDRAQFLKGIAESDIRPEWGPMLWESRFLYPPLFQIGRLVGAEAITPATAIEWLRKDRYPQEVLDALLPYYQSLVGSGTTVSPWVTKARNQLWTAIHRNFLNGELDRAGADSKLETLIPDLARGTRF